MSALSHFQYVNILKIAAASELLRIHSLRRNNHQPLVAFHRTHRTKPRFREHPRKITGAVEMMRELRGIRTPLRNDNPPVFHPAPVPLRRTLREEKQTLLFAPILRLKPFLQIFT